MNTEKTARALRAAAAAREKNTAQHSLSCSRACCCSCRAAGRKNSDAAQTQTDADSFSLSDFETQLCRRLSAIDGAGRVELMLSLEQTGGGGVCGQHERDRRRGLEPGE